MKKHKWIQKKINLNIDFNTQLELFNYISYKPFPICLAQQNDHAIFI